MIALGGLALGALVGPEPDQTAETEHSRKATAGRERAGAAYAASSGVAILPHTRSAMKRFLTTLGAGVLLAGLIASPTSAATTMGTWTQYPTSGPTQYQATVQQPLAGANTAHWSANSKGGIPIAFKLSSATGPAAFESIGSDGYAGFTPTGDFMNDAAWMTFTPDSLTFNQIAVLQTDYEFTLGDCHGGSLRWSLRTGAGPALFIYYGAYPQFGNGGVDGCTGTGPGSVDQSGTNMIGLPDLRYDTSQFAGGTFYDSYAHAQALMGDLPLTSVSLVIDSGWQGLSLATDQRLDVSHTTVNDNVYEWASGASDFTPMCDLPDATIEVGTASPVVDTEISEQPVQAPLAAGGNAFRVVDCKYQYILSIPSLPGPGTYYVEIRMGGVAVPTSGGPVMFDLNARGAGASAAGQAQGHPNASVEHARSGGQDVAAEHHQGHPDANGHRGSDAAARSQGKGPGR
jgi:hypothetical protein